ncbi:mitochondrial import inner membrane translocase subunit TIM23-1 [Selaginella moellendorffii]|nr:mitochondrial import inner membrane translocase subunit TIM23-1 [Selaginella moellendorffii]|eukprot:XP_002962867.2 mitochondrial import inner membrane translocase subunit TIM23-1 [Selaginella moellendorffii]
MERDFLDDLVFFSGAGFLTGAFVGGATAVMDCLRFGDASDTLKLRINQILNMAGHRGRKAGASLGTVGFVYASLHNGLVCARGRDDPASFIAATAGTGAIFRSAAGIRPASVAGASGGLIAAAILVGREFLINPKS